MWQALCNLCNYCSYCALSGGTLNVFGCRLSLVSGPFQGPWTRPRAPTTNKQPGRVRITIEEQVQVYESSGARKGPDMAMWAGTPHRLRRVSERSRDARNAITDMTA